MRKIIIIGSGGAGKSTFARHLGRKLNIDVFHLDAILWKPNWELVPKVEQINIQNELIKNKAWIIDGNYGGTMDIRISAADTIIFLDIPRLVCIYQAFKRFIKYRNSTRPDMREGCKERFNVEFYKWIWSYPKRKKPLILKRLRELSDSKEVVILNSPKEVKRFLERST